MKKRKRPRVHIDQVHRDNFSLEFFCESGQFYFHETLKHRGFVKEIIFDDQLFAEIDFDNYLKDIRLHLWSTTLPKYCLGLAREFYANLSNSILDHDSPWFEKSYIKGELLEVSPTLIRTLFELPDNNHTLSILIC